MRSAAGRLRQYARARGTAVFGISEHGERPADESKRHRLILIARPPRKGCRPSVCGYQRSLSAFRLSDLLADRLIAESTAVPGQTDDFTGVARWPAPRLRTVITLHLVVIS